MKHNNFTFTAVSDFFSEELKSHYIAGLSYTVRPNCEVLDGLIDGWLEEGKIVPFDATTNVQGE